jgi:DMSO reductase anchor subunit
LKKKEFLRAVKHKVWGWPAVFNMSAGGAGAGFYLLSFLLPEKTTYVEDPLVGTAFKLIAPVLVGLGFLVLAFESGRPLKAKSLFRNLRTSWMSREVLTGMSFICLTLIDFKFSNPMIKFLAGTMAIGLLLSQGLMVNRSCGVKAWNTPIIPLHFFFSGLYLGFGCLLIWSVAIPTQLRMFLPIVGLIILILNSVSWVAFLKQSGGLPFRKSARTLRCASTPVSAKGIGHYLPAVLLLVLIPAIALGGVSKFLTMLLAPIGAIIIVAGVRQTSTILLKANYFKELSAEIPTQNAYHAKLFKSR